MYPEIRAGKRARSQNLERATNNTLPLVYVRTTFVHLDMWCMYVIRHYGVDLTCRKTTVIKMRTGIVKQLPPTCDLSFRNEYGVVCGVKCDMIDK